MITCRFPRRSPAAAAAVALIAAAPALGHSDDPKATSILPAYQGPGWRASEGGVAGLSFPASGVSLQSWITIPEFGGQQSAANDCWGYTAPSGREYALIGLSSSTGFVEITDPADPQIIDVKAGPTSIWRDIKVFQHYAYAVSEAGEGIQVFDLSAIDSGVVTQLPSITTGGTAATHNVAINTDSGFLYRCGGSGQGLRIYDLNPDPASPAFVASWPDRYVHDCQVFTYTSGPYQGREIAFLCSGFNNGWNDPGIDILDVTDKQNIVLMARYLYPGAQYSHQGWLSADGQYFFLNDEKDEDNLGITSTMHVIDVSDLENPVEATTFTNGLPSITHNLYVRDNLVFAANYSSGVRIFDVSNPLSASEIGYFDTTPENDNTNFNGLWSNYPYFPSGTIIGSDREKGLFVWSFGGPQLSISFPQGIPDMIDPAGQPFAALVEGASGGGFSTPLDVTLHVNDGSGFVAVPMTHAGDNVYEAQFPGTECGSIVDFYVAADNGGGVIWRSPSGAPNVTYEAISAIDEVVALTDDMESDTGWAVGAPADDATTGVWTRVDPNGTDAQPENDHTTDPGVLCWITGQGSPGGLVGDNDIDGGQTTLTSPALDATAENGVALLTYARWYSNNQGSNPGSDSMLVQISSNDGQTWTLLEQVNENAGAWVQKSFRIDELVIPTSQVRVRFIASDFEPGSIVEAGVDDVQIIYELCDAPGNPADIDGNGVVNVDDLVAVILAWGPCASPPCAADVNGDGMINVDDLVAVIVAWGG